MDEVLAQPRRIVGVLVSAGGPGLDFQTEETTNPYQHHIEPMIGVYFRL
jgi:hypothetical protein